MTAIPPEPTSRATPEHTQVAGRQATQALPDYRHGRLHFDGTGPVVRTDFDVAAYTRAAHGPIEVELRVSHDLDARTLMDLAYLWRLEVAALTQMRALLMAWTANEARITAFLATWAYERYWSADALRLLLEVNGWPPVTTPPRSLLSRARSTWVEHLGPLVTPIAGHLVGELGCAGQMARMAITEGALHSATAAIGPRLSPPACAVVEQIHLRRSTAVDFFRSEALARISRSRPEQIAVALALSPPWRPLRPSGVADPEEPRALLSIFETPESRRALQASDQSICHLVPTRPHPSTALLAAAHRHSSRQRGSGKDARTHGL